MMRRKKRIAKVAMARKLAVRLYWIGAKWLGPFAVGRVRFERGKARNRTWREVERRPLDWASRSLKREFEVVIMVEVLIGEMFGSNR
jgi:hypothetical protein